MCRAIGPKFKMRHINGGGDAWATDGCSGRGGRTITRTRKITRARYEYELRDRTMNSNPFHPTQIRDASIDIVLDARQKAQRQVRTALLILLVPGLYNFICFQFFLGIGQFHDPFFSLSFGLNLLGILILADIVWFFGLSSLEGISARAHKFLARTSSHYL